VVGRDATEREAFSRARATMDVNDLKGLYAEVNKRMNTAIDHLKHELAGVRTGRATAGILDPVHVEAYGSRMPLNQLASLSIPEPTMIVAQPFDPSQLGAIEKAIRASDLGLNPSNDGKVVRIPIPALTEERRKELSRHVHKMSEEGRNSVRAVRRDANERLKKLLKDHKISEDDERKGLDEVQKITDNHVKTIDDLQKKKDTELLGK
jgi:ribosome recycling factor